MTHDLWITLIAFTGFAAHRTKPCELRDDLTDAYFDCDVRFLSQYQVRDGYQTYGACVF